MHVTVLGKTIYYESFGKAKQTILYVHGWGGSHKSLKKLAIKGSRKYRTVVFDLPGFGFSDNPNKNWGVKEYADLVVAFAKAIGIEETIYFGHSFGGALGVYIAANNLLPLSHLVLCAASYKREQKKSRLASGINSFIKNYLPFIYDRFHAVKLLMYRIFFRNSDLAKYPHLEPNYRKIITQDLTDLLTDVFTPTLILWGGRDTYTPVENADELEQKIENSKKVIYPHKSHNLPIRYPDDAWKEVREFISA